jgi:HEAT repeat protein
MEVNRERSMRAKELVAVKNEIVAVGAPCAPFLVDLMVLDRIKLQSGQYFVTDDITRQDCMDMLERMGSDSVPYLLRVLERKDLGVKGRRMTASTLGGTRDPRAFDPLVKLLKDDESWQVRADACSGLGKLGDRRAIQHLNQAIMNDPDPAVKRRANKARAQIVRASSRYP